MQPLIPDPGLFPSLVFDPDIESAGQIAGHLAKQGFSTQVALSAHDALLVVKQTYFRVLVVVADLNSNDCLRFLDAMHRATPRSWLIVANAHVDQTLQNLVYRHGGDALIEAPIDVQVLSERIALMQARSRPLY